MPPNPPAIVASTPQADHGEAEGPADRRRRLGRSGKITAVAPDQSPRDPAAVQGERGQEVEAENRRVDEELIGDHRRDRPRSRRREHQGDQAEGQGYRQGHRRAGEREPQLVGRSLRIPGHPRDASQQPKVDLLDLDSVAPSDHCVPELVQKNAGEQQEGAQETQSVGGYRPKAGSLIWVVGGAQREGDDADDHQPERLDPDRNPGNAADPHAARDHVSEVPGLMRSSSATLAPIASGYRHRPAVAFPGWHHPGLDPRFRTGTYEQGGSEMANRVSE